ncbi:hypothetical protein EB796_007171 [Bugula neritina]|uniref:Uncharacterized protein n=1 Tax=Bugula neritina TaxID=10212 RepID=A0A7J7KA79_BUGNE|nr:hypothetical protein EB796_007171 [Bugula neritina]
MSNFLNYLPITGLKPRKKNALEAHLTGTNDSNRFQISIINTDNISYNNQGLTLTDDSYKQKNAASSSSEVVLQVEALPLERCQSESSLFNKDGSRLNLTDSSQSPRSESPFQRGGRLRSSIQEFRNRSRAHIENVRASIRIKVDEYNSYDDDGNELKEEEKSPEITQNQVSNNFHN